MINKNQLNALERARFEPYFGLAMKLIEIQRLIGGNQFRHSVAVWTILLEYGFDSEILLKASLLHDLLEDTEINSKIICNIDNDGPAVHKLTCPPKVVPIVMLQIGIIE